MPAQDRNASLVCAGERTPRTSYPILDAVLRNSEWVLKIAAFGVLVA
jgi:hypothetical protein